MYMVFLNLKRVTDKENAYDDDVYVPLDRRC